MEDRDASAQQAQWNDLNQTVIKLWREGKCAEATKIAEQALEVATKTFGPEHVNVATSLNNPAFFAAIWQREKSQGGTHVLILAMPLMQ